MNHQHVITAALMLLSIPLGLIGNESQNLHRYFLANYHEFDGNAKKAHHYYNQLFGSHSSLHSYKGYINLLYKSGNYQRIAHIATQLEKHPKSPFENDPALQLIFALSERNIGNNTQADERLIKLSRIYKTDPEIIFHTTDTYLRLKQPENALNMLSTFLNNAPSKATHYVFHFLKAQVLAQLGKNNEAITSAQESVKLYPYFDKGWLFLAMLHEHMNNTNDAITSYKKFLETTPAANKQVESHLIELMLKQEKATGKKKSASLNPFALPLMDQNNFITLTQSAYPTPYSSPLSLLANLKTHYF